jgi:hypothetical protein
LAADYWVSTIPSQPIRNVFVITNPLAAQGKPIIGIYMGAREGGLLYSNNNPMFFAYQLNPDNPPRPDSLPALMAVESRIAQTKPGQNPYALVFFDHFLRRDRPDLWLYLHQNYTPIKTLPGRLSPATIYLRNSPPTAQP